ncbi:hypothetical protein BCR35DRAFT_195380 [Leucosporidium creatinivorum]|uniref:C3H1-type domain-containing protein n=1 Tax=Leucosporidium creatinivorum TaxID=106004 RepID=A0A1Y2DRK8_9BASI|nr:hypothetical protein BCR35DRAFT_195380 [Leucosporidium creatinivorum]
MVSSPRELDEFIASFNRAHPLYMLIDTPDPREISLQRQRALATIFTRFSQCRRLVLGRWALDLELMEMVSPSRMKSTDDAEKKPKFDEEVRFVEPFPGTWVPPHFRSREPKTIDMKGVLRKVPLRRGRGQLGMPKLNLNRGLHHQDPPICLHHYLMPDRCSSENCTFCHAYNIPPPIIEELRHHVAGTPCAIVADGFHCDDPECLFAHQCPRGLRCKRHGCDFGPHMHPPLPPPSSQPIMHQMGAPRGQQTPFADARAPPLAGAISSPKPNSAPFSPSRTARTFNPLVGVSGSLPAFPTKPSSLPNLGGVKLAASLPTSPAAPLPVSTSPRQPRPSPRSIQSWAQGITSPGDPAHPHPIAEPASHASPRQHVAGVGAVPAGQAPQDDQHGYSNSVDQEFAEMTDEQFEAYAAQLAKEEEEMLAAMSPGQRSKAATEGWGQDYDGYQEAHEGAGKAESDLFDDGKAKKGAPSKDDIWTGRKGEGVV